MQHPFPIRGKEKLKTAFVPFLQKKFFKNSQSSSLCCKLTPVFDVNNFNKVLLATNCAYGT